MKLHISRRRRATAFAYGMALAAPVVLTAILSPIDAGRSRDYAFLYLGVVAVLGVVSGVGPALAGALAGFLLVDYFFVLPLHALTISSPTDLVNLAVFLGAAALVGGVGSWRRRTQLRAQALTEQVVEANRRLDRLNREQAETATVAVRLARSEQQIRVLEETNRIRSELLANVSHELRTPLASILTGSTDMLGEPGTPRRVREGLATVVGEARRLNRLVSDLLDMARIEGHALALDAHEVDLADAVEGAVARLHIVSPERRVDVRLPDGRLELVADWGRLGQILDNLLSNADRHGPAGTPIEVEASLGRRSMVVIRVIDSGPGVPPEAREHIFERFAGLSQTEGDRDRLNRGGVGLGLAIVRGLVEAHAGRVWVEDPASGKGARFAFTLPAA